jgi:ribosomal protein L44E
MEKEKIKIKFYCSDCGKFLFKTKLEPNKKFEIKKYLCIKCYNFRFLKNVNKKNDNP